VLKENPPFAAAAFSNPELPDNRSDIGALTLPMLESAVSIIFSATMEPGSSCLINSV
jgi:hypothetical protein